MVSLKSNQPQQTVVAISAALQLSRPGQTCRFELALVVPVLATNEKISAYMQILARVGNLSFCSLVDLDKELMIANYFIVPLASIRPQPFRC